jgi:hypothetical protein
MGIAAPFKDPNLPAASILLKLDRNILAWQI